MAASPFFSHLRKSGGIPTIFVRSPSFPTGPEPINDGGTTPGGRGLLDNETDLERFRLSHGNDG